MNKYLQPFEKLLNLESMQEITGQARCNAEAFLTDDFMVNVINKNAVMVRLGEIAPEMRNVVQTIFTEGFMLGVSEGSGETSLIFLAKIIEILSEADKI